jgi:hypothetical protein
VKIKWDAFGWNIYSWGLVHIGIRSRTEEILCGATAQHGPPLTVHDDEPVTCFQCLAKQEWCDGAQG